MSTATVPAEVEALARFEAEQRAAQAAQLVTWPERRASQVDPWAEPPQPLYRELPPPEPYPVDALGPVLGGAVAALRRIVQPAEATAAQSVLAAASLAVQPLRDVLIDGRTLPCSLFLLTVAESGDRKTATDRAATLPHRERERVLAAEYCEQARAFKNAHDAYEKSRAEVLSRAKGRLARERALEELGPPPQAPMLPMLLVEEPTYEGLVKLLMVGQPSLGLVSDEGGRFLGGAALSPDNRLKTLAGLSSLWDAARITRARAGDGASVLYGRRLALHLMVQPVAAPSLLADPLATEQGFLARCLHAWPPSALGTQRYVEEDVTAAPDFRRYCDRLAELLALDPATADGDPRELRPDPLPLAPEGKRLWITFHDWVQRNLGPDGALRPVASFAAKAAEHAARLAGVLAVVDDVGARLVDARHVEAGVALVRWYLGEALRLQGVAATNADLLAAARLLTWLQARGRGRLVALADVYQRGPASVRDRATAARLLGVLAEHGHARRLDGGAELDGHHRRDVWEVRQ